MVEMAEILKKNKCNVELPISAQHIILGSDMLDYSINLFIQNRYTIVFSVSLQKLHSWVSFNLHPKRREIVHKILCNILH
jgi:hypothetical protein